MASPLTQQSRPDYFEPKIVELYRHLFHLVSSDDVDDFVPTEGFWREFFLLRADSRRLYDVLEPLTADNVLQLQSQTRLFFHRAIQEIGSAHSQRTENALDNLTGFLLAVLTKRYTNPNTDVIEVLAGLDTIDKLMSELVHELEVIIRQDGSLVIRRKAVMTALAMVSGSYQTTLVTYFVHRDLFAAFMKYTHDSAQTTPEVMILLGLLANYNKFESQNPYQTRLEDFVNDGTISRLVSGFGEVNKVIRDQYAVVQDDIPVPWTISNALSMVGLRSLTSESKKPAAPTEDEAKALFGDLPSPEASIILSAYTFVNANRIFISHLSAPRNLTSEESDSPLAIFLSTTSYLCHHAHRNERSLRYATLSLLILRLVSEDSILLKRLSEMDNRTIIRLARQRPPLLPFVDKPRIPATAILDICSDTIMHNLRKRLSIPLLSLVLQILLRTLSFLDTTKTRLQHHWRYVWGSLLALLRFLTQYANELTASATGHHIPGEISAPLTSILAFCLSRGDNFLPDPSSYDDLFYKLIEASSILPKFKKAYCPSRSSTSKPSTFSTAITTSLSATKSSMRSPTIPSAASATTGPGITLLAATNALLSVTAHYQNILTSRSKIHQSPATVQKIIREGYETLPDIGTSQITTINDITGPDTITTTTTAATTASNNPNPTALLNTSQTFMSIDFGHWEKWRESNWKLEIKKILRVVVEDARRFCLSN